MSTMDAISLTAAPANASEIALGEDVHPEDAFGCFMAKWPGRLFCGNCDRSSVSFEGRPGRLSELEIQCRSSPDAAPWACAQTSRATSSLARPFLA